MSIFDNSLEPIKRIRRKARERRLLATQNVKESLARRLGEEQDAFDHSPVSFAPDSVRVHRIACARWLSILWSSVTRWRCLC